MYKFVERNSRYKGSNSMELLWKNNTQTHKEHLWNYTTLYFESKFINPRFITYWTFALQNESERVSEIRIEFLKPIRSNVQGAIYQIAVHKTNDSEKFYSCLRKNGWHESNSKLRGVIINAKVDLLLMKTVTMCNSIIIRDDWGNNAPPYVIIVSKTCSYLITISWKLLRFRTRFRYALFSCMICWTCHSYRAFVWSGVRNILLKIVKKWMIICTVQYDC